MLTTSRKIGIVVYVAVLLATLFGCFYWGSNNVKEKKQANATYKEISLQDSISGVITDMYYANNLKSFSTSCTVDEGLRIILPWAENWAYSRKHLSRFLQEGDSLYKFKGSDTLFVYRQKTGYYFVLEKRIIR